MKAIKASREDILDLVTRRALPNRSFDHLDPFLFLNHHGPQVYPSHNNGLPFGPHPHRGFETVTFILEGDIAHKDTGGHESVIHAGGVQWMTAGRGLTHSETSSSDFKRTGGNLEILQLWVNLPKRLKMTEPKYIGLQKNQIPQITADSGKVAIELISGSYEKHQAAFKPLTDITLMILRFEEASELELEIPRDHTIFFYTIRGEVDVTEFREAAAHETLSAKAFDLVSFEPSVERLKIRSGSRSVILFGHAVPFGEPIVSHGPFVMNTREEIIQAIEDFKAGLL